MMKNIHIWLAEYLKQQLGMRLRVSGERPVHIMFCVADHFEPRWGKVDINKEIERTDKWIKGITPVLKDHKDADGKHPKLTLFYPIDEFTEAVFQKISDFCHSELGEIEVHLHHDNDTASGLTEKLSRAKEIYSKYGHLARDTGDGKIRYGFIHGNWALDNSRRDGRWCGVNNELEILNKTGCYADFTLPSAPSDTQTRKINSIYYAADTPGPKSHNTGVDVEAGKEPSGDLMIIQGPLTLNWKRRKIENSGISFNNPPVKDRMDLWIKQGVCVRGRSDWVFVKIYAHGAQDKNITKVFFEQLDAMFTYLEREYNDGVDYILHYVSAREMYNIIKAAELEKTDDPGKYRDYFLKLNREIK